MTKLKEDLVKEHKLLWQQLVTFTQSGSYEFQPSTSRHCPISAPPLLEELSLAFVVY